MRGKLIGLALCGILAGMLVLAVRAQSPTTAPASASEVVIKGVSTLPVTFDGHVSKFEYADAVHVTFPNGHGTVDGYVKCHDGFLYFAFQIPDLSPHPGDDIVTMLDTKNAKDAAPAAGDIRAYVRRKIENSRMDEGKDGKWVNCYSDWEWHSELYATGWEVETRIPLKKLGVDFSKNVTIGLAFRIWDNEPQKVWNWPAGSQETQPNTWGTITFQAAK